MTVGHNGVTAIRNGRAVWEPNPCGTLHYDYPETLCTEPAGHYRPDRDPHAGPLIIDGRTIGVAAWDEPKESRMTDRPALENPDAAPEECPPGVHSIFDPCPGDCSKPLEDDTDLTVDEARDLVSDLSADLYWAQDRLGFVGECCDIADREQRQITTADVREWLKGARCGRQAATDAAAAGATKPADGLRPRLAALRQQWAVEGPPPGVSRWWDQRLAELDAVLEEQP